MNPFASSYISDKPDSILVKEIRGGDKRAINELLQKHQPFIYNIAWKMLGDPILAEDLTQEVLLKIFTNLHNFKEASSFRTWAYRIVRNQMLNEQNKPSTRFANNFEDLGNMLDVSPSVDINEDEQSLLKEEIREVRLQCLSGMLLCLTKEQRLIYIIGDIFGADHNIGSEIMEISADNYRKKLSNARKHLHNFMKNKCGLVNKENPCRCHKKVTVAMDSGMIAAKDLLFNRKEYSTFQKSIEQDAQYLVDESEQIFGLLQRDHSFKSIFEKKTFIEVILEKDDWRSRLNLN